MCITSKAIRLSTICTAFPVVMGIAASARAQAFDFTINQPTSSIDARLTLNAVLPGTLIGNYVAVTNEAGTRTKPGFFGSFGSTENVAIPINIAAGVNNYRLLNSITGVFTLELDTETGIAKVSGYASDMLAGGPETVPVTAALTIRDSFRTRNPTSTYIAATVNVPVGNAMITTFTATQTDPAQGTLIGDATPNQYTFTVPMLVQYTIEAELLGNPIVTDGGTPAPFVLTGTVIVNGNTATVTAMRELTINESQQPAAALDPIALDLPTILPPGSTAHVLLNLTLDTINESISGTQSLSASGVVASCKADFNQDGGVDGQDVEAFFVAWEAGRAAADMNADGGIDGADVDFFFDRWEAGC